MEKTLDYKKQIGELLANGINSNDPILGVHGTSLEAILMLSEKGVLPSGAVDGEYTFYVPRRFCFKNKTDKYFKDPENYRKYDLAVEYALINSRIAWISNELNAPTNIYSLIWKAESMFNIRDYEEDFGLYDLLLEIARKTDINPKKIKEVILSSRTLERKGVVVGFSQEIKNNFKTGVMRKEGLKTNLEPGREFLGREFSCIETSNGLPIKYITGIEPLGDYEWKVLERFQIIE